MKPTARVVIPAVLVLATLGGGWWSLHRPATDTILTVYGNIDFRQASVAFNGAERIAEVLVEEGDVVREGQLLARMDTSHLLPQVEQVGSAVEAQQAVVARLRNGSRKEEIAQAKANLTSAEADAQYAALQYRRQKALGPISAVSQQEVDRQRRRPTSPRPKSPPNRTRSSSHGRAAQGGHRPGRSPAQGRPGAAGAASPTTGRRRAERAGRRRDPLAAARARRDGVDQQTRLLDGLHRDQMGACLPFRAGPRARAPWIASLDPGRQPARSA